MWTRGSPARRPRDTRHGASARMKTRLTPATLGIVIAAVATPADAPVRRLRLPATAYEYAHEPLPAHFQGARAADNTPADNPISNDGADLPAFCGPIVIGE